MPSNNLLAFLWALIVLLYWQTFLYSYEAEFVQKLLRDKQNTKKKKQPKNQTNQKKKTKKNKKQKTQTSDVLQPYNHTDTSMIQSIFHDKAHFQDISRWTRNKGPTHSDISASNLDILLNINSNGRLTTTLHDKRVGFNFSIVNFPFLCSSIPFSPAYGAYI
jgi:hypothetical protein